jgi:pre-rRNA-processing protein IPI3
MEEVAIVCSNKDNSSLGGIAVVDIRTGSNMCSNFKNCVTEPNGVCVVGGTSGYSGVGCSSGDYIVACQAAKPIINVWQWGKAQVHYTCHVQEISTSVVCDPCGTYLIAGTKKGWLYCWELSTGNLLYSWQGHFKSITKLMFSGCGNYCISSSEDGAIKVWELATIIGDFNSGSLKRQMIQPYRSWNPHTLAIKDFTVIGVVSTFRVVSCSIDKTIVMFDVHSNKQCYRAAFPQPLESLCVNVSQDIVFSGASNGDIYLLDLSIAAIGISAAHAKIIVQDNIHSNGYKNSNDSQSTNTITMSGHTRAVTALAASIDNNTIVSVSMDGSMRVWDILSRQCLKDIKPLNKMALTNIKIILKPEHILTGVTKTTLTPFEHLKKYTDTASGNKVTLSSRLLGSIPDSVSNRAAKHKIHHTMKVNVQGLSNDLAITQDDTIDSEESVGKKVKV